MTRCIRPLAAFVAAAAAIVPSAARAENSPPIPTIVAPPAGSLYNAGETFDFIGEATDAEDGGLPASAFTWQVDFHHGVHVHPFLPPTTGIKRGTLAIPNDDHRATDVFYRIHLSVVDAQGQTRTTSVDVLPRRVAVRLGLANTNGDMLLALDDMLLYIAPLSGGWGASPSIAGLKRTIGAPSPQRKFNGTYVFHHWSDGGARYHDIITPLSQDGFYTAHYRKIEDCAFVGPSQGFRNIDFESRTGRFDFEFEATPNYPSQHSMIGMSRGPVGEHDDMGPIVRFTLAGKIEAQDGDDFVPGVIPYQQGVTYRFRLAVNVATRRYSVFVREAGGAERTVGTNLRFRSTQDDVSRLNNLAVWSAPFIQGQVNLCRPRFVRSEAAPACVTARAGTGYRNQPFVSQNRIWATFEATPSRSPMDATVGISRGARSSHTGFANLVRFNSAGFIDARNGDHYEAATQVPYEAGQKYLFSLLVDARTHTYSIWVRKPDGAFQDIGMEFAFRSEQSETSRLDNWGARVNSAEGEVQVCDFGAFIVDELPAEN